MYKTLIIILFFYNFNSSSQIVDSTKSNLYFNYEPVKQFIIGFETAGTITSNRDTITWKMNRSSLIRWEPHISYYPFINLGIGITGKIEHYQSNYLPDIPTLLEIGVMTRIFIPFKINRKYLDRISFSSELSFTKSNYYYFDKSLKTIPVVNMNQNVIRIPLIVDYKVFYGLNLRVSYRYLNFINQYDRFEFSFGLEYHFIKNNNEHI